MYVILFSGKFETPDYDKFMTGLQKLVKETNTQIFGDFKCHQFVEFEMIEDKEVEFLDDAQKEDEM